jgi:hypothetical protein
MLLINYYFNDNFRHSKATASPYAVYLALSEQYKTSDKTF